MTRKRRSTRSAASYPALRQFARAYLHEDFVVEYGGAIEAAEAFAADATVEERRALAAELNHLATASANWTQPRLTEFLTETVGSAWATPSASALRAMAAAID